MDIAHFPKVELHLHLDCSLSYDVVSRIDNSITLEDYQADFIAPAKCKDLSECLARASSSYPLMQTAKHLHMVTEDLFRQLLMDNIIYAELRFAPLLHTEGGLTPHEVVTAVEEAVAEAVEGTGIEARLILCTLRFFSEAQSLETVKLVEEFSGTHVAAFDIAADRPGNVIDDHVPAFQYAREQGIPFTAHVGETRGIQNVWDTLENFKPQRFGHGVCSIQDPTLLERLRAEHIHLEACPTSNVQTNCYPTYADHPIDRLFQAGISISVNTDTRTLMNVSLTEEYQKMHQIFGWEEKEFFRSNQYALEAAFIPDDLRNKLMENLTAGYQQEF